MKRFEDLHRRDTGSWSVPDAQAHGRAVRSMFARISSVYDRTNHLLSLNLDHRWRRNLVRRLDGDLWELLDLCAGTGDLALACRQAGKGRVAIAADFCPEMLQAGREKRGAAELKLLAADALQLPLADMSVDAVVVGFGVRNFADVRRGVAEMTRVLRPTGQLAVLEFFRDGPPRPVRWLLERAVPAVGKLVARDSDAYRYLPCSMGEFLTPAQFAGLLAEFGYQEVYVERQTFGIAHIIGGRRGDE